MKAIVEGFTGHYSVQELESMADVRQILGEGADKLNWLFLSTSGVHGSYTTLDELFFEPWQGSSKMYDPGYINNEVTVLIVQPRMVRSYYGKIVVEQSDLPWLREQVRRTIAAVAESQDGNI